MQHAVPTPRKVDRKTKVALIVFIVALIGSIAALATWSAFSATTSNAPNQFSTGSLSLADNDNDSAMFNMTGAVAGDTVTKCIEVTYTGSLTSNVKLYGATTAGNGLNQYLDTEVTRGTWSGNGTIPDAMACSQTGRESFVADSVTYSGGNGATSGGVMFNTRMNSYPTSWTNGILDAPGGAAEPWTNNEKHVFRIKVTVANDSNAINKTHTQTFSWEAQNV